VACELLRLRRSTPARPRPLFPAWQACGPAVAAQRRGRVPIPAALGSSRAAGSVFACPLCRPREDRRLWTARCCPRMSAPSVPLRGRPGRFFRWHAWRSPLAGPWRAPRGKERKRADAPTRREARPTPAFWRDDVNLLATRGEEIKRPPSRPSAAQGRCGNAPAPGLLGGPRYGSAVALPSQPLRRSAFLCPRTTRLAWTWTCGGTDSPARLIPLPRRTGRSLRPVRLLLPCRQRRDSSDLFSRSSLRIHHKKLSPTIWLTNPGLGVGTLVVARACAPPFRSFTAFRKHLPLDLVDTLNQQILRWGASRRPHTARAAALDGTFHAAAGSRHHLLNLDDLDQRCSQTRTPSTPQPAPWPRRQASAAPAPPAAQASATPPALPVPPSPLRLRARPTTTLQRPGSGPNEVTGPRYRLWPATDAGEQPRPRVQPRRPQPRRVFATATGLDGPRTRGGTPSCNVAAAERGAADASRAAWPITTRSRGGSAIGQRRTAEEVKNRRATRAVVRHLRTR